MTSRIPNQCRACERFGRMTGVCAAYPRGIPAQMLFEGADHRTPQDGDGGIRFRQGAEPEQQKAFADWQETFG